MQTGRRHSIPQKHLKKQSRRHRGSPLQFPVSYHKPKEALKNTEVKEMKCQADFSYLDHHKCPAQQGGDEPRMRTTRRHRAASSSSPGMAPQHSACREDTGSGSSQEVNLAGQGQNQPSVSTGKELGRGLSLTAAPEPPRDRAQLGPTPLPGCSCPLSHLALITSSQSPGVGSFLGQGFSQTLGQPQREHGV